MAQSLLVKHIGYLYGGYRKHCQRLLAVMPILLAVFYTITLLRLNTLDVLSGPLSPYCSFSFVVAVIAQCCGAVYVCLKRPPPIAISRWLSAVELVLVVLFVGYLILWQVIKSDDAAILRLAMGTIPQMQLLCFVSAAVVHGIYLKTNRCSVLGIGSHFLWIALLDLSLQTSILRGPSGEDVRFLLTISTFWLVSVVGIGLWLLFSIWHILSQKHYLHSISTPPTPPNPLQ